MSDYELQIINYIIKLLNKEGQSSKKDLFKYKQMLNKIKITDKILNLFLNDTYKSIGFLIYLKEDKYIIKNASIEQFEIYMTMNDDINKKIDGESILSLYIKTNYEGHNNFISYFSNLFLRNKFIIYDDYTLVLEMIFKSKSDDSFDFLLFILKLHCKQQKILFNNKFTLLYKNTSLCSDIIKLICDYEVAICNKCDLVHCYLYNCKK